MFGQENIEVQEGSRWIVNVMSLEHGWTCWVDDGSKNKLAGEVMAPVNVPRPPKPPPVDGTDYKEQRNMELKCLDGEDAGTEVMYKASSYGGIKASLKLMDEIYRQLARDPHHPCPVLELRSDSYPHSQVGAGGRADLGCCWLGRHERPAGGRPRDRRPAGLRRPRQSPPPRLPPSCGAAGPRSRSRLQRRRGCGSLRRRRRWRQLAAKAAVAAAAAVPLHTGQRRRPVTR